MPCMTTFIFHVASVDPSLGRADLHSMPQQTLVELFISNMRGDYLSYVRGNRDSYPDVCEWASLECDDAANLTEISWNECGLIGPLQFAYLPRTVKRADLSRNGFEGSVDIEHLPAGLELLDISENNLSGTLDFTALGEKIQIFQACANKLSGEVNLSSLPAKLEVLELSANSFTGELRILSLPNSIRYINVASNDFTKAFIAKNVCVVKMGSTELHNSITREAVQVTDAAAPVLNVYV